jgi:hypothetical protein
MTSEGLGEMFEGDSADTCGGKIPLMLMGGRAEGLAYADLVARTPTVLKVTIVLGNIFLNVGISVYFLSYKEHVECTVHVQAFNI